MQNESNIHSTITAILRLVLFLGILISLIEGNLLNAVLIAGIGFLTLLPIMLGLKFRFHLPAELELLVIAFIFGSLFLGEIRDWYNKFWWWDVLLHTGSGLMLGMLGFLLVYVLNAEERIELYMKPGFVALFSFAFAVAAGAIWEIFEYTMDVVFGFNMQKSGLTDTMWDLIVDTVGAAVIAVIGYWYMKYGTRSVALEWVKKFVNKNPRFFGRHPSRDKTSPQSENGEQEPG